MATATPREELTNHRTPTTRMPPGWEKITRLPQSTPMASFTMGKLYTRRVQKCRTVCASPHGEGNEAGDGHTGRQGRGPGWRSEEQKPVNDLSFQTEQASPLLLSALKGRTQVQQLWVLRNEDSNSSPTVPQLCTWVVRTQVFHCYLNHIREVLF
jgi:hypothetical protein